MSSENCSGSAVAVRKSKSPFLNLPGEIRNHIYDYVLETPDMALLFTTHLRKWRKMENLWTHSPRPSVCFFRPQVESFVTPAILLLNRQINVEAASFLRSKPFVIDSPPPHCAELGRDFTITEFISVATLKKFTHVVLEMDLLLQYWNDTLDTLFNVWAEENDLKLLHIRVKQWETGLKRIGTLQGRVTASVLEQVSQHLPWLYNSFI